MDDRRREGGWKERSSGRPPNYRMRRFAVRSAGNHTDRSSTCMCGGDRGRERGVLSG